MTSSKIQYFQSRLKKNLKVINFFLISDHIDWEQILCSKKSDDYFSMNEYLPKIDSLLETYAPLKKLDKKEMKFLTKPWITYGLENSIKKKNTI